MRYPKSSWLISLVIGLVLILGDAAGAASLRDEMIAKAKQEGQVVVGGSNADIMRNNAKEFRAKYPFLTIKALTANTATTVNRVTVEARARTRNISVDVIELSNDGLELLAKEQILTKREFPHLADFPAGSQPTHGLYVNSLISPRPQGVYNTELVKPHEVPKSWDEMTDPKWTGRTMISSSSEEFPAQIAWLWRANDKLNWERSFDFFRKLAQQQPMIARGYRGGMTRLAAGEVAIFWFAPTGPASSVWKKGGPIGFIAFPKYTGEFRSLAIPKHARHPAAAWLFIDYLTSPKGQFWYTEEVGAKLVLNKKAKGGKLQRWLNQRGVVLDDLVPLDVERLFKREIQKKSQEFYFKLLGIR